ncbi:MAG: MFS transporter [Sandaracinaceae bacterium]|nr:MFS transporter [Sandaracinaceae bacterium]
MRPMVLLFVALFNSILGLSVLFPIFGPLGRALDLTELEVGLLSAGYALMQLLLAPVWGRRSETAGRKPILLLGVTGFAVGFYAFGGAAWAGMNGYLGHGALLAALLGARVVGGAFSSATLPTAQAYAADISGREQRTSAMAVIGAAFGLGIIFGPAIGAGLVELTGGNLLAPIWFSASVAVVNAMFIALRLPEPEPHRALEPPPPLGELAKKVWPILSIGLVATVASVAMEQTVAFYFQDRLGIADTETPKYVGAALFVYGVVAVFAQGYLVRRREMRPITLLRFGVPLAIVGYAGFVFAHTFWELTTALAIQGLGQGLLLPGVTAAGSLAVGDESQGSIAGLNSASTGIGRLAGPLVGGGLYQLLRELPGVGPEYTYALSAALLVLVLVVLLAYPRAVSGR